MTSTTPIIYALLSVTAVSFVSLVGLTIVGIRITRLKHLLIYLVALSAGAFFGDVFFHLIPEMIHEAGGRTIQMSTIIISGLVFGLFVEKILRRRHCHLHDEHHHHGSLDASSPHAQNHKHSHVAHMSITGDIMHNLIDGLIIGSSYLVSIEVGIATTIAIILHEIPQEL